MAGTGSGRDRRQVLAGVVAALALLLTAGGAAEVLAQARALEWPQQVNRVTPARPGALGAPTVGENVPSRTVPPANRFEVPPVTVDPGRAWDPGHWRQLGGSWVWSPGRMLTAPAPGLVWQPGTWTERPWGWIWNAGTWQQPPQTAFGLP